MIDVFTSAQCGQDAVLFRSQLWRNDTLDMLSDHFFGGVTEYLGRAGIP
jgi:hypothetical protein